MPGAGWILLHRKIINHWVFDNPEHLRAWLLILLEVNHEDKKVCVGKKIFMCKRGDSFNSLDTWSRLFGKGWNKSKTRRFLKLLEGDFMIRSSVNKSTTHLTVCNYESYQDKRNASETQITSSVKKNELNHDKKTTHLTVCNYESYQDKRNTNETQMKHKRNTNETQMTPNKELEELKELKEDIYSRFRENVKTIINYLNFVCGTKYKPETKKTVSLIVTRLNEKYTVDDFKAVIDQKSNEWKNDGKYSKYLRPETLFGNKFEGYLNTVLIKPKKKRVFI